MKPKTDHQSVAPAIRLQAILALALSITYCLETSVPAALTITLETNSISEAAGTNATYATVQVDSAAINTLLVTTVISDPTEIAVPVGISISAGSNSVTFPIHALKNDGETDGPRIVTLSVGVGIDSGMATLVVADDDTPSRRTLGGWLEGIVPSENYLALTTINVAAGNTLTIAPSSRLRFASGCGLFIDGNLVALGNSNEVITFESALSPPTNGSWAGIRVSNTGQPRTRLEHVEIAHAVNGLLITPSDDVFELTLSRSAIWGSYSNGIEIIGLDGGFFLGSNSLHIFNNTIHDNGVDGIYIHSRGQGCGNSQLSALIIENELFGNRKAGIEIAVTPGNGCSAADPRFKTHDAYVAGNVIYGNVSGLIASMFSRMGGGANPNARARWSSVVENNLIFNNSSNGVSVSGSDLSEIVPRIVNNTIVRNGRAGFAHGTNVDMGFVLQNNIVALNQEGIVAGSYFSTAANVSIAFNNLWGNIGDWTNYPATFGLLILTNQNGTPADEHGNISANPLFVSSSDYHLQADSPVVDAGMTNLAPLFDFEGQSRRSFPDMGYDELATIRLRAVATPLHGMFQIVATGGRGTSVLIESTTNWQQWTAGSEVTMSNRTVHLNVPASLAAGPVIYRGRVR